jgi:hypothetical protein
MNNASGDVSLYTSGFNGNSMRPSWGVGEGRGICLTAHLGGRQGSQGGAQQGEQYLDGPDRSHTLAAAELLDSFTHKFCYSPTKTSDHAPLALFELIPANSGLCQGCNDCGLTASVVMPIQANPHLSLTFSLMQVFGSSGLRTW